MRELFCRLWGLYLALREPQYCTDRTHEPRERPEGGIYTLTRHSRAGIPLLIVRTSPRIASHPHLARPRGMAALHRPHVVERRPRPRASGKHRASEAKGGKADPSRGATTPSLGAAAGISGRGSLHLRHERPPCQRGAASGQRRAGPRSQVRRERRGRHGVRALTTPDPLDQMRRLINRRPPPIVGRGALMIGARKRRSNRGTALRSCGNL